MFVWPFRYLTLIGRFFWRCQPVNSLKTFSLKCHQSFAPTAYRQYWSSRPHELIKIYGASWYWEVHQFLLRCSTLPWCFHPHASRFSSKNDSYDNIGLIVLYIAFCTLSFQCHPLTLCFFSCRTIKVEVYDWDRDGRWVCICLMCSKPFTTSRSSILVLNICFLCFFPVTGASPLSSVLAMTLLETIRPATGSWLEGRVSLMYMRWVWLLIPYVTFLFPTSQ